MKKILFIMICLFVLSCNKSSENSLEVENLLAKISTLEEQNKILKDSLESSEATFLYSQILIGISDKPVLKVGENDGTRFDYEFIPKID